MRRGRKRFSDFLKKVGYFASDVTSDEQFEIHSNKLMLIAGCRKLTGYDNRTISLTFKRMSVVIEGRDLEPESLVNGQMAVRGSIEAVRFIDN